MDDAVNKALTNLVLQIHRAVGIDIDNRVLHAQTITQVDPRMKFDIRDAVAADGPVIAANNSAMAEETEGHSLAAEVVGPGVDAVLADPGKGRYWVAEHEGTVIGQIMVTWEWSDWRNGMLWWVQSVYVAPDYRRQGVFSALYRFVEKVARDAGAGGIRLYVEKDNTRAQATYRALGMVDPGYRVMEDIF